MATDFLSAFGVGRALMGGRITTANDTAPTITSGVDFTAAWTAEGRITVTLSPTPAPMQIVSVLVGLARETLPTGTTTETAGLVQCYIDQDSIDANSFEVRLELTADIGATEPNVVLDDLVGSEIHFLALVQFAGSTND